MAEKNTQNDVVPTVGEQLASVGQLDLSVPEQAASFLIATRTWDSELRSAQSAARRTLRETADARGQRTFDLNGHKIVVDNPALDRSYDVAVLHDGLADAGLDSERLSQVITYEPKVNGKVIRELERHPQFKVPIDAALVSVTEKTRRVEVK